jgi:EmrB/QacA subfamily drug resistance transporter
MEDRYAKKWRALIGISLLAFIAFMDYGIVNTILPGIQADLLATVSQLQWVMNVFFMALAMFMVTVGRVGDLYGRRRVLYIGVVVFGIASVACSVAPDVNFLIPWRAVQGVSAAILLTCAASLVTHAFPQAEQGRALGIFLSITAAAMAIGPVLGGSFLSFLNWRWAFYVNVPVIVIGFLICRGAVPETPRMANVKLDVWGLLFLVPGIGVLVLAIMEGHAWGWTSPVMFGLYAMTVVCVIGFIVTERRVSSPIIDLRLFRHPMFLTALIAGFSVGAFVGIGSFLPPLYLMNVQGFAPYAVGLMLLPIPMLVVIVPPLVGKWIDTRGPVLLIVVGQIALLAAAFAQMQFIADSPIWFVLVALGLFGLGWGLQQGSTVSAATSAVPPEDAGVAVGALWTFWNIGSVLALSIGGLILNLVDRSHLNAALADKGITLADRQQHVIRSLLADPTGAERALGELPAKLSTEIVPLFHESFMAGYDGAMTFMAVLCGVALIGTVLAAFRARTSNQRTDSV